MQSRRGFVKSFLGTTATLALARKFAKASAQKAALATAQFRESGTNAKLLIHPLRNNVSMISGSGGNVLVLPGPEGKLVVDSGLATSSVQMAKPIHRLQQQWQHQRHARRHPRDCSADRPIHHRRLWSRTCRKPR
jgi:hypothetical protein